MVLWAEWIDEVGGGCFSGLVLGRVSGACAGRAIGGLEGIAVFVEVASAQGPRARRSG
jgi:hypothetical protein